MLIPNCYVLLLKYFIIMVIKATPISFFCKYACVFKPLLNYSQSKEKTYH